MIRGVREKYPEAKLSILVEEGFRPVVANNPDLDEIIDFPRVRWADRIQESGRMDWGVYRGIRDLVRDLKERCFDLVINRQFTDFEALLTTLICPGEIRGKVMDPDGTIRYADPVTDRIVRETRAYGRRPSFKNLVDLSMEVAGAFPSERRLIFPVHREVEDACRGRLSARGFFDGGPIFGIQPGASRSFKELGGVSLPLAEVVDTLIRKKNGRVLFFGSREERLLGETILELVHSDPSLILNLMGETTLEELGGYLACCDLLISGDTGTAHVAAAVGTRTVTASYGMTYPYETAPYGPGHLVLYPDLSCAPCDDPESCEEKMSCQRVLKPAVLLSGIEVALALLAGDQEGVQRWSHAPSLRGVRLLYTGEPPLTSDLMLRDLRREIPELTPRQSFPRRVADPVEGENPAPLPDVPHSVRRLLERIDAAMAAFSAGEKAKGFQAIEPCFDLFQDVIRGIMEPGEGSRELLSCLTPVPSLLSRLGAAMERMDLAFLQEILVSEMRPLVLEMEKALTPPQS